MTRETDLAAKTRDALTKILHHVLADESLLSAMTRDFRWRVTGPNVYSLRRLFDEQRRQIDYWFHQLFDRMRDVGVASFTDLRTPSNSAAASPGEQAGPLGLISELLQRHEEIARNLREEIERLADPVTVQLLTRVLEFHETSAWMLRMLHDGPETARP